MNKISFEGRTAFVLPSVFNWTCDTIKFVVEGGERTVVPGSPCVALYGNAPDGVPNSWIIMHFQAFSDIRSLPKLISTPKTVPVGKALYKIPNPSTLLSTVTFYA